MQAKYPGHCNLCGSAIAVGDEIIRDNNQRPHRFYVHAPCKPVSGRVHRAGYRVTITAANSRDFTVGYSRQFVYESKANEQANWLRGFGCEVEVVRIEAGLISKTRSPVELFKADGL